MKSQLATVMLLSAVCGYASAANYTLTIDGKDYEIDLSSQTVLTLADGRALRVTLNQKPTVSFKSENFSFDHLSALTPARTKVSEGIFQTMMASPRGTIVIIQEYTSLDPSSLIALMLNELTKKDVQFGYKMTRQETTQKLADGTTLTGKTAVGAYKDKESSYRVLCYGTRDAGLLFITHSDTSNPREELQIIDVFWETLKILLKK